MDPENIEMKDLDRGRDDEAEAEKDEEDTSFLERAHRLLDDDEVLEMDGSDNLFVQADPRAVGEAGKAPSTSASLTHRGTWDPNAIPNPKRDAGVIRRHIIYDKKQFINKVFGMKVNKGAGPYSKILYDELRTTTGQKSGKINGATYKGKKILLLMKSTLKAKITRNLFWSLKTCLISLKQNIK